VSDRVFTIDGEEYPIPTLFSFTMDEAVVFFQNNGYPVEDLWPIPAEDDEDGLRERLAKLRHPQMTRTLLHVAYRRGNPGVPAKLIEQVVGSVPLALALAAYIPDDDVESEEAVPLGRTNDPDGSSLTSSPDENENSGTDSTTGSALPDSGLSPTGTTRSDTSPTFDPVMSAA
jgi:hypothetical protein